MMFTTLTEQRQRRARVNIVRSLARNISARQAAWERNEEAYIFERDVEQHAYNLLWELLGSRPTNEELSFVLEAAAEVTGRTSAEP